MAKDDEFWTEPEFDEKNFLLKEIVKGKATIIVFILSVCAGFASGYLQHLGLTLLSALLGLALIFIINPLYNHFNLHVDKRTHAINILIYIILWISFWIIALNPPFS